MKFKKVFIDGNVIIDIFDETRETHRASVEAIRFLLLRKFELLTSSDLITTIYYILAKIDRKKALRDIKKVIEIFDIIPFSKEEVKKAIALMEKDRNFKDLEDTIQYVLAKKADCDLILSNDKGFYSPDITILTAKQFLEKNG
jgi:predicted nucleic acid-binding protein